MTACRQLKELKLCIERYVFHLFISLFVILGLPTNFNQGMAVGINCGGAMKYVEQQTVRKGQKSTYYCEICMLDLNR